MPIKRLTPQKNRTAPFTQPITERLNPWLKQAYRRLSGNLLGLAVKPQLIGELPTDTATSAPADQTAQTTAYTATDAPQPPAHAADDGLTFYVLKEYSRSNSILIDLVIDRETKQQNLPPALADVVDSAHGIRESSAMVFLHHYRHKHVTTSPRLLRLITAVLSHPTLNVRLIPVTILWGRAPEKEDSLFNLLTADEWQVPSIGKQLFNIGAKGRDTFVEFHPAIDLRTLLNTQQAAVPTDTTPSHQPNQILTNDLTDTSQAQFAVTSTALISQAAAIDSLARMVQTRLQVYLDQQQAAILGPDLSDRRNVVDKLLYSPAVQHAIELDSQTNQRRTAESRQLARGYLNEIASDYSHATVRFLERFLTWLWTQLYDGVEVRHFERVRALAVDHEIVYVPCHRSHMDYLLLSYLIFNRGLRVPYIAAGDNLNIPILGQILKNGGAFFMRRSFKDNPLYGAVFREYVHSILVRGTPLEYFIEGGRSRSGRLLPPKKGMLAMTVQSHLREAGKPIVFMPTYIGYERIMEGGTYVGELQGKPKESESLLGLLKAARKIERIFGTVHVSFGQPLFLADFMQKYDVAPACLSHDRTDAPMPANAMQMIDNLSVKIMQGINRAVVINPVSLLSLVLLDTPHGALDEQSCLEQLALYQRLAERLPYDEDTSVTTETPQAIIDYGIRLQLIERTPHMLGDLIRIAEGQAALLSYFRNNILHVYILLSLCACLVERNGSMTYADIARVVGVMYPFLQAELFLKYPSRELDITLRQHLAVLADEGLIAMQTNASAQPTAMLAAIDHNTIDAHTRFAPPAPNTRRYQQLAVLANAVEASLERYFMILALLSQQGSGKLTKAQTVDLGYLLGQRVSALYEDDMPDFFDRALFSSFLDALERLGYITLSADDLIEFDTRMDDMAQSAGFILKLDVLHILRQLAALEDGEVQATLQAMQDKKARKHKKSARNKA